jgi:hypothetical protein
MARWLSASARTTLPRLVEVTPTTVEQFTPQCKAAFEALLALA